MGIGDILKTTLPWIATTLGGPLAGIAVDLVTDKLGIPKTTAENLKNVLSGMPPEKLVELKQVEADLQVRLATLGYDNLYKLEELAVRADEATNKTMQAEAASEHWPTYSWRPFIGFVFGACFAVVASFCCYLAYMAVVLKIPEAMNMIPTLITSMTALFGIPGAVLGVASYFRGKMQADPTIPTVNRG